jgi:hypothetical protein
VDLDDLEDPDFEPQVEFKGTACLLALDSTPTNRGCLSRILSNSSGSGSNFGPMDLDSAAGMESGTESGSMLSQGGLHDSNMAYLCDFAPPASNQPNHRTQLLIQSTLPFKSIPRSEWIAQETKRYHERRTQYEEECDRLELMQARVRIQRRRYERLRKRAQRERQKQVRLSLGKLKPKIHKVKVRT